LDGNSAATCITVSLSADAMYLGTRQPSARTQASLCACACLRECARVLPAGKGEPTEHVLPSIHRCIAARPYSELNL
jgi:hypothetical protein